MVYDSCMVYGVWCNVYGVWCNVYGAWYIVYGVWQNNQQINQFDWLVIKFVSIYIFRNNFCKLKSGTYNTLYTSLLKLKYDLLTKWYIVVFFLFVPTKQLYHLLIECWNFKYKIFSNKIRFYIENVVLQFAYFALPVH